MVGQNYGRMFPKFISETAVWFLVGVICSTIIIVVFFLYITKRFCFRQCDGCDALLRPTHQKLGSSSISKTYDDSDSASSVDSAEEASRVIRKSIRSSRSSRIAASLSAHSLDHETRRDNQSYASYSSDPRSSSRPSRDSNGTNLDTQTEYSANSAEIQLGDSGATKFEYDDVSNYSTASPSGRRGREFAKRAVRQKTPSPSMRGSQRSLNSLPESGKWEAGETGSIYSRQRHDWSSQDSDDDKLGAPSPNLRHGDSSMAENTSDDETQYRAGSLEPISACGTLDVAVQYSMSEKKLQVTIIEAHDLPSKARGGYSIIQVRAVLLPEKRKKYKTKVQHISSPRFAETFKLSRAGPEDLKGFALRLRMYGIGKLKDSLIGEAVIRFDELNLIRDPQLTIQLQLEPRTNINHGESDLSLNQSGSRSSSMMSLSHGGSPPEILIGLSYSAPTGRLCVKVIKGSHFRNLAMSRPPDTYVKLSLLNSSCQEMSQSKTSIRRGQPNPVYQEEFFFQVALFQLGDVTLMISVFNKKPVKKKEMIGWVSMGRNSSSEIDDQHWIEMKEGKGQEICRWHELIDT